MFDTVFNINIIIHDIKIDVTYCYLIEGSATQTRSNVVSRFRCSSLNHVIDSISTMNLVNSADRRLVTEEILSAFVKPQTPFARR